MGGDEQGRRLPGAGLCLIPTKSQDGLDISGAALASEVRGMTYVVIYLAPAEHYFEATLGEVESIMASVRPPSRGGGSELSRESEHPQT